MLIAHLTFAHSPPHVFLRAILAVDPGNTLYRIFEGPELFLAQPSYAVVSWKFDCQTGESRGRNVEAVLEVEIPFVIQSAALFCETLLLIRSIYMVYLVFTGGPSFNGGRSM